MVRRILDLPDKNLLKTSPSRSIINQILNIIVLPPPRPDIHLRQLHKLGPFIQFPEQYKAHKYREQDIVDDEILGAKGVEEGRVSLEEDQEDVCR